MMSRAIFPAIPPNHAAANGGIALSVESARSRFIGIAIAGVSRALRSGSATKDGWPPSLSLVSDSTASMI